MVFAGKSNGYSTGTGIDLSPFDPILLRDQIAFESAMCSFEQKLFDPGVDMVKLVDDLLSVPNLFELLFSAAGDASALYLQEFVIRSFPRTASEFYGSQAHRVLDQLARFAVAFALSPSAVECFRAVQLGSPVLTAILTTFGNATTDYAMEETSSPVSPASPTRRRRNFPHPSQREKKQAARNKGFIAIDPKPFKELNIEVPVNKDEADALTQKILLDQRNFLEQYFSMLRNPSLFDVIKSVYIPTALPEPEPGPEPETPIINGPNIVASKVTPSTTSTVFPMVQPLRAALHFDSPEGFGEWRIMIPSSAHRGLRDARRRNPKLFNIIVKKIKELSNGHFSDDNQKKLNTSLGIPIFEAKMTSDTRLVYQIDCNQDFETGVERQVIQIYGIYTHAQLKRFDWDGLGSKLAKRGPTYRERCIFRSQPGKDVTAPGSFPPLPQPPNNALKLQIPGRHINGEEEKSVMLEKFAAFSNDFLTGILADDDGAYVFQMSPTEQQIVKHVGSSYVLGRSGTGKTTSMLYKILGMERAWQESSQHTPMVEGIIGKPRQLFVTKSKMLAMKVEEYYYKLATSHGVGYRSTQQHAELLINHDEETGWRKDLPRRFGQLKDEHFPLFLTFDELCEMLENEYDHASKVRSSSSALSISSHQQAFVSWRRFRSKYWPHLPQNLTKHFEPYLVFGEFMGVIKGSEKTLTSPAGYLDSDTYFDLSRRVAGTFASHREDVYQLFEAYLCLKRRYGDIDAADRTQKLRRLMGELGIPDQLVDYIYVDEAQDNLLIDAMVLRSICRDSKGLFWAGDTAQTISVGSAFRFNDLKAFLWRVENMLYRSAPKTAKPPIKPKTFQLAINYRSHAGIIDFAQTVIHIITKFWPDSIDILKEEKGDNEGVKPIVFTGWTENSIPFEQHLFGDRHHQIEFGANQCILVRNELARNQLRERVGEVGMILTLEESKGLEFNDVLLYNFFNDSDVSLSNWRIVSKITQDDSTGMAKSLDVRHTVVCRELKFLYVAVTRARNNVWIVDSSNKGDPMKDVWLLRGQIEICTSNDPIPKLAVSSAQEEWAERGRSLFKHRTYRQAVHCFERAGLRQERNVAHAYSLQQEALLLPEHSDIRTSSFTLAAEAFIHCATSTLVSEEAKAYYRLAGRCFSEIGEHQRAGDMFLAACYYTGSAQAYRKANNFDDAVEVIQKHIDDVDPDVTESIISVAKLHYFKEHQVEKALELFESPEEAVGYTEDFGFDEAQADILVGHMHQPTDAAELHFREGRIFSALDLLLELPCDASIHAQCVQYIMAGIWRLFSVGVDTSKIVDQVASLFSYARKVSCKSSLLDYENMQLVMFSAILRQDYATLYRLSASFLLDHQDKAACGLCLDYVFADPSRLIANATSLEDLTSILCSFLEYANLLAYTAYDANACGTDWVQRLFGFTVSGDNNIVTINLLSLVSFEAKDRSVSIPRQEITVSVHDFVPMLQAVARRRLRTCVRLENEICTQCPVIFPCTVYAIYGECSRKPCATKHTRTQQVFSVSAFNLRLRIVMQQILIYRTAEFLMGREDRMRQRRFWLRCLYDLFNPPHPTLGSFANIDCAMIPEYSKGILSVNYWVQDRLFSLTPCSPIERVRQTFLTSIVQKSSLGFLLDREQAQKYLNRAPFVYKRPPFYLFREGSHSIIHSVLRSLDGSGEYSFSDGLTFLWHVIERKLHLDIGIICNLLEHLCGLLVIAFRWRLHTSLHDTVLPRDWLLKLTTNPSAFHLRLPRSSPRDFITLIRELFRDIFSFDSYDYLFFVKRSWYYSQSWDAIQIFLSRICRCLCLVGYNIGDDALRHEILQITRMLASHAQHPLFVCERYANARTWEDLWRALRTGNKGIPSSLDELVLVQITRRGPEKSIPGIVTVTYTGDLGKLTSKMRADATAHDVKGHHVYHPASASETHNKDSTSDEHREDTLDASSHETKVEEALLEPAGEEYENERIPSIQFTQEQIASAKVILRAYRSYVELKYKRAALVLLKAYRRSRIVRQALHSPTDESRSRWKDSCRAARPDYIPESYRLHLIVHLPRALVCLDRLKAYAIERKAYAKRRLKADKSILEDVNADLNHSSGILKQVKRLEVDLNPSSDFHRLQDAKQFQQKMQEIGKLVLTLPYESRREWEFDFEMAMRAVKRDKETHLVPKKAPRPRLNTQDLDLAYY